MSVNTFKPEVWSAMLLESLKTALVAGMLVNRDYEGEISQAGDTVRINSIGRPTVSTYTPGTTTIDPEQLQTAEQTLLIDQSKYFAFEVDDVDRRQAKGGLMDEGMKEAAYALAKVADTFILGLHSDADTANELGTVAVPVATPAKAYDDVLVPLKIKLDEKDVPEEGRWCVIPPWFHGRLLRDDRFIDASRTGDAVSAAIRGFIGAAAGFRLFLSNNLPSSGGDNEYVIAGYPGAISYAEQIASTEAYRPENSFSDAVKGLHLYGGKLVRPSGLATCDASET